MSASVAIQTRALELRAAGAEVIALSAGEPDFDTPAHIVEAAGRAMRSGHTRYTAVDGVTELKHAVCEKFRDDNGLDYRPGQVAVTAGGKQAIYNALAATVNRGDEIVFCAPCWVSYPAMATLCGGRPVVVETRFEDGFGPDPERIAAAITPRTRWLILNSPGNPGGAVIDEDGYAAIAEVLRYHPHVAVVADDIYEHIVYAPARFVAFPAVAPDLSDRILVVNGVSKTFAMTGWRIGFAAGPEPLIEAMRVVQSQTTGNPCSISQQAALAALTSPRDFLAGFLDAFRRRRDLAAGILDGAPGMRCRRPDGAFYLYVGIDGCIGKRTPQGELIDDDETFARLLLESAGVAVVHGAAYGMSPCFRVSFAVDDTQLDEACRRIERFTRSLT